MPHRPERTSSTASAAATAAAAAAAAVAAGAATAPVYNQHLPPASAMRGTSAAHIMRPAVAQSSLHSAASYHPGGIITPVLNSLPEHPSIKHWQSAHMHRVAPNLEAPKSSDSTDRSTVTKHDEECTVGTLATEATADELEKREATQALLLVSTQPVKHATPVSKDEEKEAEAEAADSSTVPLKKRKKHLDFLRRNQEDADPNAKKNDPCHVSPVSHSSAGSHVEGRTVSSEEGTPGRPNRVMTTGAQRSNSYDSKESPYQPTKNEGTRALLDSAKIIHTQDIAPPAHVVVPHFPSVLHQVLSDGEYAGKVVQWLPDGEAWKVLRWDALRRQVLPRYFSELTDEHGKGSGTIDAFLWHLTAWGFDEVKDGTDVGAYRHDLFIRGAQKLCSKMRFTAVPADEDPNLKGPKTVSPCRVRIEGAPHSILQVPSLTLVNRAETEAEKANATLPNKRPRYDSQASPDLSAAVAARRPSPGPLTWPMGGYRPEDHYPEAAAGWGHYYPDSAAAIGARPLVGHYARSVYDPRFHVRHIGAETGRQQPPQYPPPQVRSGRGSLRLAATTRTSAISSPGNTPAVRASFPVSNRGKGPRRPPACRPPAASTELSPSNNTEGNNGRLKEAPVTLAEAQRIGGGVAVAVSRKSKRKLPLARKTEAESS